MTVSAWAVEEDLPVARPSLPETGGRGWDDYLLQASEILFALSGSVYDLRRGSVMIEARRTGSARPWGWAPSWGVCRMAPHGVLGDADPSACCTPAAVDLPDSPIVTVDRVLVNGVELPAPAYEVVGAHTLRRLDGRGWETCSGQVLVAYTYGNPPPEAGRGAAVALAVELAKLDTDPSSSKLSRKAQQLTRQGVTVSGYDPAAIIAAGRTGVEAADLWLSSVLIRPKSGGWVWSPDLEPLAVVRTPVPFDPTT